jgi:3-dehydroquinate dehydratase-2
MRIAVLNGPNLNLLGRREPEVYGHATLADIEAQVRALAAELGVVVQWQQTNHEGVLIDAVQQLPGQADGAIVNAGALTHTSLGLRDAFLAVRVPFVEVHLSNLFAREAARQHTLLADLAVGFVCGFGAEGYLLALRALASKLR